MRKTRNACLLALSVLALYACGNDSRGNLADITPPTVASIAPSPGERGLVMETVVSVTFTEAFDLTTFEENFFFMMAEDGVIRQEIDAETALPLAFLDGPNGEMGDEVITVEGTPVYDPETFTLQFTPSAPLAPDTFYTWLIGLDGVLDVDGNQTETLLGGGAVVTRFVVGTFTTGNTMIPVVESAIPFDGALNVPLESSITISFSELLNEVTANEETVQVTDSAGEPILGDITVVAVDMGLSSDVIFEPDEDLPITEEITVTLSGIEDLDGVVVEDMVVTFTTEDPAVNAPPTLLPFPFTSPENGAVDVPLDEAIVLTFSEDIFNGSTDPVNLTFTEGTEFTVVDSAGVAIPMAMAAVAGSVITVAPPAPAMGEPGAWPEGETIAVTVFGADQGGTIVDDDGALLEETTMFAFTTVGGVPAGPDLTAPTATISPAEGEEIAPTTNIVVTFDEALDDATVNMANFTLTQLSDDTAVPGMVLYDTMNFTVTFVPENALTPLETFMFTISADVTDVAGNAFAGSTTMFSTSPPDDIAPTLDTPVDGSNDTEVAAAGDLVLTFSEPVLAADGDAIAVGDMSEITIVDAGMNSLMAMATVDGAQLTINAPAMAEPVGWPTDGPITVTIAPDQITDLAGNPLAAVDFMFNALDDVPALSVDVTFSTAPLLDGTFVPDTDFVLTFSEPVDPASVIINIDDALIVFNAATGMGLMGAGGLGPTSDVVDNVVTINAPSTSADPDGPDFGWPEGSMPQLNITAMGVGTDGTPFGITGLNSGLFLADDVTIEFTVEGTPAPPMGGGGGGAP